MKVVSSIFPSEELQKAVREEFPEDDFEFYKGMDEAERAFYSAEVFITE
ncbi:hypothetical protein [Bacillus canaveralius]|nr:hypothetical protein [Bacillus canaveralius]